MLRMTDLLRWIEVLLLTTLLGPLYRNVQGSANRRSLFISRACPPAAHPSEEYDPPVVRLRTVLDPEL
jgi:hypothetical protein